MILVLIVYSLTEQHNSSSDQAGEPFMDLLQMKMTCNTFSPVLFWFDSGPTILPSSHLQEENTRLKVEKFLVIHNDDSLRLLPT